MFGNLPRTAYRFRAFLKDSLSFYYQSLKPLQEESNAQEVKEQLEALTAHVDYVQENITDCQTSIMEMEVCVIEICVTSYVCVSVRDECALVCVTRVEKGRTRHRTSVRAVCFVTNVRASSNERPWATSSVLVVTYLKLQKSRPHEMNNFTVAFL